MSFIPMNNSCNSFDPHGFRLFYFSGDMDPNREYDESSETSLKRVARAFTNNSQHLLTISLNNFNITSNLGNAENDMEYLSHIPYITI
jgi:hypothetical protein